MQVDKLMALRKQINEALAASGGAKLSVNDFIVKASALVRLRAVCVQLHLHQLACTTAKQAANAEASWLQLPASFSTCT